jgi:hypothetical protein
MRREDAEPPGAIRHDAVWRKGESLSGQRTQGIRKDAFFYFLLAGRNSNARFRREYLEREAQDAPRGTAAARRNEARMAEFRMGESLPGQPTL